MENYEDLIHCRQCERLVAWREEVAFTKRRAYQDWQYWGKPIPAFGDLDAEVLVVGLAPGAHGSNRTGRMFTGDASGDFLYPALYRAGFASQPTSYHMDDGLTLKNLFITAVCRCVPPQNKPTLTEINNCLPYLRYEISQMRNLKVVVALGSIAQHHVLKIFSDLIQKKQQFPFGHGRLDKFPGDFPYLISSYHPSRQNTQTGRLTIEMFDQIWSKVNQLIS
ncbi:MAG: uracil-DNA glycosylase [Anaerolineaceae bacterium]|nr:uracil-DNA glycosylase [Anaerolineaceae bacterium]